ncbi:MAG: TRAP transporter substrate-binding protein DctP [Rhodospirillales bacterium]|nr:MAG: TRAP transporter substrate-binding protein DctP [Rhodospirillales bacterium]
MFHATRRALAIGAALFGLAAPAAAQEPWKLASAAQPGSVLLNILEEVIAVINDNAGGAVKVERQFVGNEQEMFQQLIRGRLQLGGSSPSGAAVAAPDGIVVSLPYLWSSDAERVYVTDKYAVPVMRSIYAEKGIHLILMADVGWNDVVCKTPCLTPASVKGMKARVAPTPASKLFWQSLGANGVQMPLTELWPGLEQNLVSAADLPFLFYITTPGAQSAPHYVHTRHLHHPAIIVANKALWDKLPAATREKIEKAMPSPAKFRKMVDDDEKVKIGEFRKKGGHVHELTDAQRAEWRKLVEPGLPDLVKSMGGRAQELFDAIQKGRKEFAALPK